MRGRYRPATEIYFEIFNNLNEEIRISKLGRKVNMDYAVLTDKLEMLYEKGLVDKFKRKSESSAVARTLRKERGELFYTVFIITDKGREFLNKLKEVMEVLN